MKYNLRTLKGKRIVGGDPNLATKNEIHVTKIAEELGIGGNTPGQGDGNTPSEDTIVLKKSKKWIWRNSSVKNRNEFETNLNSGGEYEEKYKAAIGMFVLYVMPYEIIYFYGSNDFGKRCTIDQLSLACGYLNNSLITDYTTLSRVNLHYAHYIIEDDNHTLLSFMESVGESLSEEELVAQMASLGWERVSPEEYEEDKKYLLSL